MRSINQEHSILGIDPSPRGLAFVFFENGTPLDWGTRRKDGEEVAVLDALIDRFRAEVLVLEDPDAPRCERRPRMRKLLRLFANHAQARGVVVVSIARYAVRSAYAERGLTRKHAVAVDI